MDEVPSLLSLCMKTIAIAIADGFDNVQVIYKLPPELLDSLMMNLPPVALQNLHELSVNGCSRRGFTVNGNIDRRKRERHDDFNVLWKTWFKKRWDKNIKEMRLIDALSKQDNAGMCRLPEHDDDWQQLYWERHLQNCLDEAAERASLSTFDGSIGALEVPDHIMKAIGFNRGTNHACSKLSYHCNNFARYIRSLRVSGVLCVPEICELINSSELQGVVFRRIMSTSHVDAVCVLLNQHRETLKSLRFVHCRLPSDALERMCTSLYKEGTKIHSLEVLSFEHSISLGSTSSSRSNGLLPLISSGRSLKSLFLRETNMGPEYAKMVFDTLIESSCGLVMLEVSDNNIVGCLSKARMECSLLGTNMFMTSLRALNLRGNNLSMEDTEDLSHVLVHMPNLRTLDISDNPMKDDGIRSLIPYLTKALEKVPPLSDIKIENCQISSVGMTELLRSLVNMGNPLNSFSVADNELGSSVATLLTKFLSTSQLKVLNIEDIGLDVLGFKQLEEGMVKEVPLVHINMSKNRGGIKAASFLSKVILKAPDLVALDAGYNLMPPDSSAIIYDALKESRGKLERLDLTGNTRLFQSNYTHMLLELHIHGKPIVILPSSAAISTSYDDDP